MDHVRLEACPWQRPCRPASLSARVATLQTDELDGNERHQELLSLGRIAHAMRSFVDCADFELRRWSRSFDRLGDEHKQLLQSLSSPTIYAGDCQQFIQEGVHHNDMFLRMVLEWLGEEGGPWPLAHASQAADMWVAA